MENKEMKLLKSVSDKLKTRWERANNSSELYQTKNKIEKEGKTFSDCIVVAIFIYAINKYIFISIYSVCWRSV